MAKKWFRIATAGQTTDGREIQTEWLEQMASSYDPSVYGARINVEHMRGFYPDSDFGSYGDVVALKTEEVSINGETALALFAQIEANDKLKTLNAKNQKIYTSVEIDTNFAKTGKAYLVGLAVTDSPASLGTEMLKFAATAEQNPLANKKLSDGNLFTAATLVEFDFSEPKSMADVIVERITQFFSDKDAQAADVDETNLEQPADTADKLDEAVDDYSDCFDEICRQFSVRFDKQQAKIEELTNKVAALSDEIEKMSVAQDRPLAVSHTTTTIDC